MTFRLAWDRDAFVAVQSYRDHEPELSAAIETVLDELRASGTVRGREFTSESTASHLVELAVPGYSAHVVIWIRQSDDRPRIVYIGPLDAE